MRQRQRRYVAVLAALLVAAMVMSLASAFLASGSEPAGASVVVAGAPAQAPDSPSVSVPEIIPQPNAGRGPASATDRGGWVQYAVFWGMCAAVVVIIGLVVRESRRKLRRQAEQASGSEPRSGQVAGGERSDQTRSSTRSEPVADTSANAPESSARS